MQNSSTVSADNNTVRITTKNIGLAVLQKKNLRSPLEEIPVVINPDSNEELFKFNSDSGNQLPQNEGIMITLPGTIFKDAVHKNDLGSASIDDIDLQTTVQFIHFNKNTLFTSGNNNDSEKTSDVFSIAVGDAQSVNLSEDLKFTIPIALSSPKNKTVVAKCVFWDFSLKSKKQCITDY